MLLPIPPGPGSANQQKLLEAFTGLKDVQLRSKWETQEGVYLAESHNVIERAFEAGHHPLAFFVIPKWVDTLTALLELYLGDSAGEDVPIFVADPEFSAQVTGYPVHRGALGLFVRPSPSDPGELLDRARRKGRPRVAVLEALVDHTNVGALFRSAAALGIGAVLVSPTCADPLYRRSVRVSMGAVFQVPWARLDTWPDSELFDRHGYVTAALTPSSDAVPLDRFVSTLRRERPQVGLALLLGSEGPGLTEEALQLAETRVGIPLENNVDSLNVATAGAIAFWEARRIGV